MHGTLLVVQLLPIQLSQAADEKFACKTHQLWWSIPPSSELAQEESTFKWHSYNQLNVHGVFFPVLEYSTYILSPLLSLPLWKTNQAFIVKRGWQHRLLVQAYHVAWRDQTQVGTLNSDPVVWYMLKDTQSLPKMYTHVHTASISRSPSLSLVFYIC